MAFFARPPKHSDAEESVDTPITFVDGNDDSVENRAIIATVHARRTSDRRNDLTLGELLDEFEPGPDALEQR